jgi:copper(I)-binding protein
MIMSPVDSIEVPAGGTAKLAPGGLHIMLFDLAAPLVEGDTLELTLEFEEAGDIEVAAPVERRMGHDMGHGGMSHGASGN